MTDPLADLAHHIREATRAESVQAIADRCGLHKNYIHRAAHPHEEHGDEGERYSPVVTRNLSQLLRGCGLTFAPASEEVPNVAHLTALVERMDLDPVAKEIAIEVLHVVAEVTREEERAA